ncbi:MAG TPA: hypothetical protein VNE58_02175 [Casimicrobiaceae bacterium]|nr:hypothetical protein [Casimicrobiaceae bacterium]
MRRKSANRRWVELSLAAPAVIALRTAGMLSGGEGNRREMQRMTSEKVQAFGEAWTAMAMRQQRAQLEWWLAFSRSWWTPARGFAGPFDPRTQRRLGKRIARSQAAIMATGIVPLHRTATANLRRLSKRRSK